MPMYIVHAAYASGCLRRRITNETIMIILCKTTEINEGTWRI